MKISAVILAKDASQMLPQCINSVAWCDEVIVIDDDSIDDTVSIARKLGAKVYNHSLDNNFSEQRNFALEKAEGEWVFFVDADEIAPSLLREEIQKITTDDKTNYHGFLVKRIDYMWGKEIKHGEVGNIWLLRLAQKNTGKWQGKVHETWDIKEPIGKLQNPLFHYPHPTVNEFLKKINFYTTLRAQELYKMHLQVTWLDIILYPKSKFVVNYFLHVGFLDGVPGFLIAILMSFHSFLVRAKLWQLYHQNS